MSNQRPAFLTTEASGGQPDKDLLLYRMTGSEHISEPYQFKLELLSDQLDVAALDYLGKLMTVVVQPGIFPDRYFSGLVSEFSLAGWEGEKAKYLVTLRPWFWFLTKTHNCRIFQNLSVLDITKEIFREHGFSDFEEQLNSDYSPREYCVQYRESDFNFICRLLEEEGIFFYFKHEANKHTLVLCDNNTSQQELEGYDQIPYYPDPGTVYREEHYFTHWHIRHQVESGSVALSNFDFVKPKAGLDVSMSQIRNHEHSGFEVFDYPGPYLERDQGERYARIRIEQLQNRHLRVIAQGNVTGAVPGGLFTLSEHPLKSANAEYMITAVKHDLTVADYETGRSQTTEYKNQLEAMTSAEVFRPLHSARKVLVSGPQTGIVVGPSGEEIWTDEYGRVKVQFHWDRFGRSDENSSCWIRVSQQWAGAQWGAIQLPRIGQEVIVDFLEGDPDQPIITGRVYNADNMPPYALPDKKTQSGIKSRSTKTGTADNYNEIRFDDAKGQEKLVIHAEKDQQIVVENAESHQVGSNRNKSIGNDEEVSIGQNQTVTIGQDKTDTIGQNRNASIGASDVTTVGASRSLEVGAAESVNIGANASRSVADSQTISIGSDFSLTIGGDSSDTIGKSSSSSIGESRSVNVGKSDALSVGKKLVIDAGDEITLQTGKAKLIMKKNGDITLQGNKITVKGSSSITVKSSSAVTIKGSKINQN